MRVKFACMLEVRWMKSRDLKRKKSPYLLRFPFERIFGIQEVKTSENFVVGSDEILPVIDRGFFLRAVILVKSLPTLCCLENVSRVMCMIWHDLFVRMQNLRENFDISFQVFKCLATGF